MSALKLISLSVVVGSLFILYCLAVSTLFSLIKNPDLHLWPSVTRCRLCDKRVFAWQRKERRNFEVKLDNPHQLAVGVGISGIVHRSCKGTPVTECSVSLGQK